MKSFILTLVVSGLFGPVVADTETVSRFRLDGDTLHYDTELDGLKKSFIHYADIDGLRLYLQENPEISNLVLNSEGGYIGAAMEMGRVIVDFNLSTRVEKSCLSACVILLAAGHKRSVRQGALVGLHRPYWRQASLEKYYEDHKEEESWDNVFDFSEWLHDDALLSLAEYLEFMLDQGVEPRFRLSSLRFRKMLMWYPDRDTLAAANLITPNETTVPDKETDASPHAEISMR